MDSPSRHDVSDRAVPAEFETFEVSIQRIGKLYRASVTTSPVGETSPVEIDPSGLTVGSPVLSGPSDDTRDIERHEVDRDDLRAQGERLFRAVFVGGVVEAYRGAIEHARGRGKGLRICFKLDEAAELSVLPWEALWDPDLRVFLADQPDLPLVRTLRATTRWTPPPVSEGPLRMLALLPEPRGQRKLDSADEWKQIRDQLTPLVDAGTLRADPIEPPTLDALGSAFDAGPCHILHIVAHGGAGGGGDGGSLQLEKNSGGLDEVTGDELAWALAKQSPPRLVLVNACHGARAAEDDAFDGLAQRLINRGVTAVVAMRTAITNPAAVAFAVALYRHLVQGQTVEASVVEARRALALGAQRLEWATPALYARDANVRIFEGSPIAPLPLAATATGARRHRWLRIALLATVGFLGLLGWRFVPQRPATPHTEPEQAGTLGLIETTIPNGELCPTPLGLEDLEFVLIEADVVDTGERKIVNADAFCIATKEVSRRDWQEVFGGKIPRPAEWPLDWPITGVTTDEVAAFFENLEARSPSVTFRLPTADEWEFAARAGSETAFFFGSDVSQLHRFGNCDNYLGQDGFDGPAPIGSYLPNAWGLYDVHGNVAEWVQWPEGEESTLNEGEALAMRVGGHFKLRVVGCDFLDHRTKVKAGPRRHEETGFRVVREVITAEEAP